MAITDYTEPLTQLLTQGECSGKSIEAWLDYGTLGITSNDIPGLIHMATDDELYEQDSEVATSWGPVHAWRALGQLRAEAAVLPLLQQSLKYQDHDGWQDWMLSEFPTVFGMIGAPSIPALGEWIHDRTKSGWERIVAADGLETIADMRPELTLQCVEIFLEELTHFEENDPEMNAFVIGGLVKLRVMEAVPLIEQAFAADKVDEMFNGDWDEVQVSLGLKSRDEVPHRRYELQPPQVKPSVPLSSWAEFNPIEQPQQKAKKKAKRKQQAASRRANRKKK